MAMFIVSSPQRIRGFSLVGGESVLITLDNEQFAAHVVILLTGPVGRKNLGAAACDLALSTVDWAILGKRLVDIVKSVQRTNQ